MQRCSDCDHCRHPASFLDLEIKLKRDFVVKETRRSTEYVKYGSCNKILGSLGLSPHLRVSLFVGGYSCQRRHSVVCRHGFGVGPRGAKFAFAQQYLKIFELHSPAWHVPSFADTKLSHSIEIVKQYMIKVATQPVAPVSCAVTFRTDIFGKRRKTLECNRKLHWRHHPDAHCARLPAAGTSHAAYFPCDSSGRLVRAARCIAHREKWRSENFNQIAKGEIHGWSDSTREAADKFMPNNTGDGSGALRWELHFPPNSPRQIAIKIGRHQTSIEPRDILSGANSCQTRACTTWGL